MFRFLNFRFILLAFLYISCPDALLFEIDLPYCFIGLTFKFVSLVTRLGWPMQPRAGTDRRSRCRDAGNSFSAAA